MAPIITMLKLFKSGIVFFVVALSSCQSVQEKPNGAIDSFSIRGGKVYKANEEEQKEATKVEIQKSSIESVLN